MPTIDTYKPVDWALLGVTGGTVALTLCGAWYAIPWRRRSRRAQGTKEFNVLWKGRATLVLFCSLWAASQLLRIGGIWGRNSFVFPALVTGWTGAGWMCRIYLTAALGFFQPFCSLLALFMLRAAISPKPAPSGACHGSSGSSSPPYSSNSSTSEGSLRTKQHPPARRPNPNRRLLGVSLLATLPALLAQGVAAWLSLALSVGGQSCERRPRAVLGYFFAAFWYGDTQQCGGSEGCTLCVFPATSAVVHAAFSVAYSVALWLTCSSLAAAVLNKRLKRRLRLFCILDMLLNLAGAACLGASVATGPFSWANQGCWLGYFATVMASVLLLAWELAIWPARDLSRLHKSLKQWLGPNEGLQQQEEEEGAPGEGLIKAVPRQQSALGAAAVQPAPPSPAAAPPGMTSP